MFVAHCVSDRSFFDFRIFSPYSSALTNGVSSYRILRFRRGDIAVVEAAHVGAVCRTSRIGSVSAVIPPPPPRLQQNVVVRVYSQCS